MGRPTMADRWYFGAAGHGRVRHRPRVDMITSSLSHEEAGSGSHHVSFTRNRSLGQVVTMTIDRPVDPKHGFVYPVNYGYVAAVIAPDGDELDAYLLGVDQPVESA